MSANQAYSKRTAIATLNDYEYNANFNLGFFENQSLLDRAINGINFCMKQSYVDKKLNEQRLMNCYKLRKAMLETADRLNMFD